MIIPEAAKDIDYTIGWKIHNDMSKLEHYVKYQTFGFFEVFCKTFYVRKGKQLWVTKEVSDEMQIAYLDPAFSVVNTPWLGKSVEFYFEDPELPSVLIDTHSKDDIDTMFNIDYCVKSQLPVDEFIRVVIQVKDGTILYVNDHVERINTYLQGGGITQVMRQEGLVDDFTCDQTVSMRHLLKLCVLCALYSSIHRPVKQNVNKLRQGQPGVNKRPTRDSFRTVSLPRFERVNECDTANRKIKFKGRCPYFRLLRSEKFTYKKGTVVYVRGVPDPLTGIIPSGKRSFRLHKVN